MSTTIKFIVLFFDIIVPRFVVERLAVNKESETQLRTVCLEKDITKDTVYTGIVVRTCFNFFGVGFFMKHYDEDDWHE